MKASTPRPDVLIALPVFGGMVHVQFMGSLFTLINTLLAKGIPVDMMFVVDSLITRARNKLANQFLHGASFTHLLFIDVDSEFDANDIIRMIEADVDVIGLPWAKKVINWKKVASAAQNGVPADELSQFTSSLVGIAKKGATANKGILEVDYVGTGLMLVKRHVFGRLMLEHPDWEYTLMSDEGSGKAWAFFGVGIHPTGNYYLSEDWKFCSDWKELGGKIHMLVDAKTVHHGAYGYIMDVTANLKAGIEP